SERTHHTTPFGDRWYAMSLIVRTEPSLPRVRCSARSSMSSATYASRCRLKTISRNSVPVRVTNNPARPTRSGATRSLEPQNVEDFTFTLFGVIEALVAPGEVSTENSELAV